ncbi:MAG: hypothetical protein IKO40_00100, partial [Kiritimatiellae bacterium]|nr:hypothetical protein [Kiritimatiellia bacterium]
MFFPKPFLLLAAIGAAGIAFAQNPFADAPDPIASEFAVPGGAITYAAAAAPKSLNPYLDNNVFSYQVFGSLYETLLSADPLTGDNAPGLARKWEVSEDKREFTFFLNPIAKWSDGQPVTAHDVLWTFNAIMAPSNQTGAAKVALQTFTATPPEVIDDLTIKFTADEGHWRNLNAAGVDPDVAEAAGNLIYVLPENVQNAISFISPTFNDPSAAAADTPAAA